MPQQLLESRDFFQYFSLSYDNDCINSTFYVALLFDDKINITKSVKFLFKRRQLLQIQMNLQGCGVNFFFLGEERLLHNYKDNNRSEYLT